MRYVTITSPYNRLHAHSNAGAGGGGINSDHGGDSSTQRQLPKGRGPHAYGTTSATIITGDVCLHMLV